MMNYVLKNGLAIIDPANNVCERIDLVVKDGKVYRYNNDTVLNSFEIIDCEGKIISPGFIDVHVHLRDPGFEYKEDIISGSKSAIAGGMTTIFSMPNTVPVADNPETIRYIIEKSKNESFTNVFPIASISVGSAGNEVVNFRELINAGAITFSDDGKWISDSSVMMEAMRFSSESGIRIIQHCEDKGIAGDGVINFGTVSKKFGMPGIPSESESVAVYRDISICSLFGAKLHVAHLSLMESMELVAGAKNRGVDITCEVTPHHLLLDEEMIDKDNADYKVNPPLRSRKDRLSLIDGLKNGLIDVIATDHAPHSTSEKEAGFMNAPFGMIGLETAFSLLYTNLVMTGSISLTALISKMSQNPAKIFNLRNKGNLFDGSDADIVIIDLNKEYVIEKKHLFSKSSNTPFHGWKVFGQVTDVFVNGSYIYHNGNFLQKKRVNL